MKTLTRDEFESLIREKSPYAELADESLVGLTIEQALEWFDFASAGGDPSFVQHGSKSLYIGVRREDHPDSRLDQIGGTQ